MILVDDRKGSAEYAAGLRKQGIESQVIRLDSADMAFVGKGPDDTQVDVGIELKKIPDLGSSLRTGRLCGDQFVKMQQTYNKIALIVEGKWKITPIGRISYSGPKGEELELGGWTAVELQKRLLTLQFVADVPVIYTHDKRQTLIALTSIYRWWTDKDFEEHRSHVQVKHSSSFFATTQFVKTIETLPGVGVAVAKAAEKKFNKSIRRALTATPAEWSELKTIDRKGGTKSFGMAKAQKLEEAVK